MVKRTKKILEWIEAYIRLVNKDIEYFEKSIAQGAPFNKNGKFTFKYPISERKRFRRISDKYNEATNNLIKKLP